jgi:hypothetical protein
VCYVEKTGRKRSGGSKAESSRSSEDPRSKLRNTRDVRPEGTPETSSLKKRNSKEDRPEVGLIEASGADEKRSEKTCPEESPSEENGPASGAGAPSLSASFIPSGEALLVSRADWDAIARHAEGTPSKKTRHVLEIRSGRCTSSIPAERASNTSVRRFVPERREGPCPQFPIIRAAKSHHMPVSRVRTPLVR